MDTPVLFLNDWRIAFWSKFRLNSEKNSVLSGVAVCFMEFK